jgi:hypothetical protein
LGLSDVTFLLLDAGGRWPKKKKKKKLQPCARCRLSAAGMLSCSVSKVDCHITALATVATVGRPNTIISPKYPLKVLGLVQ